MTKLFARFLRDERGVGAMEFALVTPALVLVIAGIAQLGILFMANAGLRNAVAEGARYATIWPRPSDTQITTRMSSARFGLDAANLTAPTVTHGTADGVDYVDITMAYTVNLNFVFFNVSGVTLSETRRAYVHPV